MLYVDDYNLYTTYVLLNFMERNFVRIVGLFLLIFMALGIANANWEMFGGNVNRTFAVNGVGKISNMNVLWSFDTGCPIQAAPIVVDVGGKTISVFNTNCGDGKIFAINLDDKKEIWNVTLSNYSMSQPVYYDGLVFVGNDVPWGTAIPSHLYAYNISNGNLVWSKEFDKSIDTSPLVIGGILYFGLDGSNSSFVVLNATTGENLTDGKIQFNNSGSWEETYLPGLVMSSFSLLGDEIVVGVADANWGNSGWLYLINKSGYVMKNVTVPGYVKSAPAIYNNNVFLGTGSGLFVYDSNLNLIANYSTEPIQMGVNVNDYNNNGKPEIVFGVGDWAQNSEKKVYVLEFNGTNLSLLRTFSASSYVASVPLVVDVNNDGKLEILFEDHDNSTYLYDYDTGSLIKELSIKGTAAPLFYDVNGYGVGQILLGSTDNKFYLLGNTFNVTVVVVYPNGTSIERNATVGSLKSGKEILENAGFNISGSLNSNWGFMLNCIDNFCSGTNLSWWSLYIKRNGDTGFSFSPVGLGPGGSENDFCWNRDLSSYSGHYCAFGGDIVKIVPVYTDFNVKSVSTNVSSVREDDWIKINVTVSNDENYGGGNVSVRLYDGSNMLNETNLVDLTGESNLSFTVQVDRNSDLFVKAVTDEPIDSDVTNNQKNVSISVRYCGDGICSSWEDSSSCSSDCSSNDDGGSGSTSTNTANLNEYINTIFNPGEKVEFNVSKGNLEIKSIEIKLKNNVTKFVIKINNTGDTVVGFNGKLYQLVEFNLEGITDENIDGANITFKVNKSWLEENNVSYENIRLFRYHDGEWIELNTTFVKQEDGVYYFKSFTPGFSYFAIGTAEKSIAISNQEVNQTGMHQTNGSGATPEKTAPEKSSKSGNPLIWIGVAIVIAVVSIFAIFKPKLPRIPLPKFSGKEKSHEDNDEDLHEFLNRKFELE